MAPDGYPSRVRDSVSKGRSAELEAESMRNLAYVVSSANDNIKTLQKTVKQQEKEIAAQTDQVSSLQRNYETLSRIRKADTKEFTLLKGLHEEQQAALSDLQESFAAERERAESLEAQLASGATERAELQELRLRVEDVEREKAKATEAAQSEQRRAAELHESAKGLKLQLDKLSRAQVESCLYSYSA